MDAWVRVTHASPFAEPDDRLIRETLLIQTQRCIYDDSHKLTRCKENGKRRAGLMLPTTLSVFQRPSGSRDWGTRVPSILSDPTLGGRVGLRAEEGLCGGGVLFRKGGGGLKEGGGSRELFLLMEGGYGNGRACF